MKIVSLLTAGALVVLIGAVQYEVATAGNAASAGIAADDMGLSKTSVFTEPTPVAPVYDGSPAPAAEGPGTPPQIPHAITGLVPVTITSNACLGCHDKPAMQGQKIAGMPTPMPASHYENTRDDNAKGDKVRGQRYVCTQCHAPQADVKPLVQNQF